MTRRAIDVHIHLDQYKEAAREEIIGSMPTNGIEGLIAVSMNLASCKNIQNLYRHYPERVHPAYGFHPEQPLIPEHEMNALFTWIRLHAGEMIAVGEVGLPYYARSEAEGKGEAFHLRPYARLLERFVALADELNKPIALHAVYEDAETACDILESRRLTKAHFHWYKGNRQVTARLIHNGYFISVTPDVIYEKEIQQLVTEYPITQMMVETDGPWPFEGPFAGKETRPHMIFSVIDKIAEIKSLSSEKAANILYENTRRFYL